MQTHLGHMQFNIQPENMAFYKDLLTFAGWQTLVASPEMLALADKHGASLWFVGQTKAVVNDYDGPGMNHIALHTTAQADVDAVARYLADRGVELLFETPRHRPEFSQDAEHTYYQVMFETPDRILVEVVYLGPKAS